DNEMSISPNVGALSRYFSRMRTSEAYFAFKLGLKRFFSAIPLVGKGLTSGARRIKETFKRLLITETLFENMGLEYYGPVAGDDIGTLIKVLTEAKKQAAEHGAVVVHVNTKKGKGFKPAEDSPSRFHSTGPFSTDGLAKITDGGKGTPTFTEAFAAALLAEADKDSRICAVTAAMTDGCGLGEFRKRYPDRFFDVGIAEEHAVTFAGGLASRGMKPVVAVYSTFTQRVFDQVWHDVALQNVHALFVLSHSGVVPGDGVTHQGIYDVSLLSPIPGIRIYSPDAAEELKKVFASALREKGTAVVRYAKGQGAAYREEDFQSFDGGKSKRFGEGRVELLAVTYGRIAENLNRALEEYSKKTGKTAAMVVLTRIVPMNTEAFRDLTEEAEQIVFVEEGIRTGGIAEQFAAEAAEHLNGKPVRIRAVEEGFLPHGTTEELHRRVGMDTEALLAWLTEA
ncbi:MAG: 1-deoxy-D-xylulose-5-phosphate synthase, partial [Clostridia bacterium]|nr:1-deoxy-D-xylulose-5-phosphate synthase [Clostridia bacterium]